MIDVRAAASRFTSEHDGVRTRHCFSAGSHYDPDNVAFGPLIAVDEHTVAPGSGFARHTHRGVVIVSRVIDGTLRHEDAAGGVLLVGPGELLVQQAGDGIEHSECNAARGTVLHFVQMVLLSDVGTPSLALTCGPVDVGAARFSEHTSGLLHLAAAPTHLFVARGRFALGEYTLGDGDAVRTDEAVSVDGTGELLVCLC